MFHDVAEDFRCDPELARCNCPDALAQDITGRVFADDTTDAETQRVRVYGKADSGRNDALPGPRGEPPLTLTTSIRQSRSRTSIVLQPTADQSRRQRPSGAEFPNVYRLCHAPRVPAERLGSQNSPRMTVRRQDALTGRQAG